MTIAMAIILVTVVGLLGAVILVLAARFMAVEEDPRVGQVQALPARRQLRRLRLRRLC